MEPFPGYMWLSLENLEAWREGAEQSACFPATQTEACRLLFNLSLETCFLHLSQSSHLKWLNTIKRERQDSERDAGEMGSELIYWNKGGFHSPHAVWASSTSSNPILGQLIKGELWGWSATLCIEETFPKHSCLPLPGAIINKNRRKLNGDEKKQTKTTQKTSRDEERGWRHP